MEKKKKEKRLKALSSIRAAKFKTDEWIIACRLTVKLLTCDWIDTVGVFERIHEWQPIETGTDYLKLKTLNGNSRHCWIPIIVKWQIKIEGIKGSLI